MPSSPAPTSGRIAPLLTFHEPPRLYATVGPIAATVCLGTYVLISAVVHGLLHVPPWPSIATNVLGVLGSLAALALMRRGRALLGTRLLLATVLADTVADMFLGGAAFDPVMVYGPMVIVGACLLLGTRDAIVTAAVYLVAIPASVPWRALASRGYDAETISALVLAVFACIGSTLFVVAARRTMCDLTRNAQALAARLAVMVERAPDGIVLLDEEGTVRHANPAAQRCLAPHALSPGVSFPALLLRHDGSPADAPYLLGACDGLLRAYVRESRRDLAITGAIIDLPANGRAIELMVRDVSPRPRERREGSDARDTQDDRQPHIPMAAPVPARHVLLVEDDVAVREIVVRQLQRMRWEVTACGSAVEALQLIGDGGRDFDVLLSDVRMPVMDGSELARRVRALRPTLPIVLMSGDTAGLTSTLVLPGPAWHFLAKPFDSARLRDVIDVAVGAPR